MIHQLVQAVYITSSKYTNLLGFWYIYT